MNDQQTPSPHPEAQQPSPTAGESPTPTSDVPSGEVALPALGQPPEVPVVVVPDLGQQFAAKGGQLPPDVEEAILRK